MVPVGLNRAFAALAVLSALVVVVLGVLFAGEETPSAFDRWADAAIAAWVPQTGPVLNLIEVAGDPLPAIALTALLAALCLWLGSRSLALTAALGSLFTGVAATVLKPLTGRTIHEGNLCFPSGHTAAVTVFGLVLGLLAAQRFAADRRLVALLVVLGSAGVAGTSMALLLVTDRIHYSSDTVGGFFTALAVVLTVGLVLDRRSRPSPAGRRLCSAGEYPSVLLSVAGYGLPGDRPPFPAEQLDELAWAGLLAAAEHNRLTGLLVSAVCDGALPATPVQVRQARSAHRAKQLRVMALEQELISVLELLAGQGIDSRVLKGSAVAHLDYPDPALRSYIDMDVLVRARDIDRAVGVLSAAGYVRTLAERCPGFDRRFDKGMTLISPTSGFGLDLHRTLELGPWGLKVDLDGLWDEGQQFQICGRSMRALSRPNRFMHACYHSALGDWPLRLGSLRDVVQLLRHDGADHTELRRLAVTWGVEAVVAAAVADACRLLGTEVDPALSSWAANYRPSNRERRYLALHTHEDETFAAQRIAILWELPGVRDKLSYAWALVKPDPEYTVGRGSSVVARFGHALREIRKGRGRSGFDGPVPTGSDWR